MEYRKIGDNYYIRMDRGDEIISNLLEICEKESIPSAVFSGIGGCQSAELQVFIPETGSFETEQLEGMLELVSLNGNVVRDDDGKLFHHTKEMLDDMHLRKIDMADEIFVVNVGGYVGESTRREIAYAEKTGKKINYLEKQDE